MSAAPFKDDAIRENPHPAGSRHSMPGQGGRARISKKSVALLLLASLIWGFAFVAQSQGMDHMPPFSFNGSRYFLGFLVLLPLVLWRYKNARRKGGTGKYNKDLLIGGLICGVVLAVATNFQQVGIIHTTVGKAGFITTLYIIIVPLMGVFLKRKVDGLIWAAALLAAAGLYLLCINEGFTLNRGDLYILISAFVFSVHILLIAHFAPRVDGIALSLMQFFVAGLISISIGFPLEQPAPSDFLAAIWPLAYVGILSTGGAFTLQIIGQRGADPAVASLIFSLEAVFAALGGFLILGESLSGRELAGCAIMLAAVALSLLTPKNGQRFKRPPVYLPICRER